MQKNAMPLSIAITIVAISFYLCFISIILLPYFITIFFNVIIQGIVCRSSFSNNDCEAVAVCDGINGNCPSNPPKRDGVHCKVKCLYLYLHTSIYIFSLACMHGWLYFCLYALLLLYMYVCHLWTYLCIHAFIHVCKYVCLYACIYVCTGACIHLPQVAL